MAKRRLTGVTKAVAYGEDSATEIQFTGTTAKFLDNAYNCSVSLQSDEIDVTAFGDFPFKANEAAFMDITASISLRHQVETTTGATPTSKLADDVEFLVNAALTRKLVRLAFLDDRTGTKPNGYIFTMSVISSKRVSLNSKTNYINKL